MSIRLWGALVAIVTVVGFLTWSHTHAYKAGAQAEQAKMLERINKENEDAGAAAEAWRAEFRRCIAAGGVYQFESGSCHK